MSLLGLQQRYAERGSVPMGFCCESIAERSELELYSVQTLIRQCDSGVTEVDCLSATFCTMSNFLSLLSSSRM
jgi:hypothetical protein